MRLRVITELIQKVRRLAYENQRLDLAFRRERLSLQEWVFAFVS